MLAITTTIMSSIRVNPAAPARGFMGASFTSAALHPADAPSCGVRRQVETQGAALDRARGARATFHLVRLVDQVHGARAVAGDERAAGRIGLHGDGIGVRVGGISVETGR